VSAPVDVPPPVERPAPSPALARHARRLRWLADALLAVAIGGLVIVGRAKPEDVELRARFPTAAAALPPGGGDAAARAPHADASVLGPGDLVRHAIPRSGNLVVGARLCFPGASTDSLDALDGLVARWAVARDGVLAADEEVPLGGDAVTRLIGADGTCLALPSHEIDGAPGAELALQLAGEPAPPQRAWLERTPLEVEVVTGWPLGLLDRTLALFALLSVVARVAAWQHRPPPDHEPARFWRRYDLLLGVPLFIVGVAVAGTLAALVSGNDGAGALLGSSSGILIACVAVSWGLAARRSRPPSLALGAFVAPVSLLRMALLGVLLALATAVFMTIAAPPQEDAPIVELIGAPGTLAVLVAFACLAPWYEEVFYHGFLFGALARIGGTWVAAAASAASFALIHVDSKGWGWTLIPVLVLGIAASIVRARTRSIAPCVMLHLGYNAALALPALVT
jgi:membrane protease YdiL (CAAX protease family)